MIKVTFCGHRDAWGIDNLTPVVIAAIEKAAQGDKVQFLMGGNGAFDGFALRCGKAYKTAHPDATLLFVTPYLDPEYLARRNIEWSDFDGVVVPPIEGTPPKYAIRRRNEYMVDQADLVIAYVDRIRGGAYTTLCYAYKRSKAYCNLGSFVF